MHFKTSLHRNYPGIRDASKNKRYVPGRSVVPGSWVGWLVGLFNGVSTLSGPFSAELSHFDKGLYVWFGFKVHQPLWVI